jgi:hypothetical protein
VRRFIFWRNHFCVQITTGNFNIHQIINNYWQFGIEGAVDFFMLALRVQLR